MPCGKDSDQSDLQSYRTLGSYTLNEPGGMEWNRSSLTK